MSFKQGWADRLGWGSLYGRGLYYGWSSPLWRYVVATYPLTLGAGIDGVTLNADTTESVGSNLVTDSTFDAVTKATAKGVAGITKANPGVVTFDAAHGYADGDIIYFSGLTEMTELNGQYWQLQNNAGDTFELAVVYGGASLDTSGYGAAETTGGNCAQACTFQYWSQGVGWHVGVDGAGALTGKAQKVAGTASTLTQNIGVVAGNVYRAQHTQTTSAGAGTYIQMGGGVASTTVNGDDTYVSDIDSASYNPNISIYGYNDFSGTIDNVTVQLVTNPKQNGITVEIDRDSNKIYTSTTEAGVTTVQDTSDIVYGDTYKLIAIKGASDQLWVFYNGLYVCDVDVSGMSFVSNKRHYIATGEGSGAFSVERLRLGSDLLLGSGSFTSGAGNPWIPTGWTNFGLDAGEGIDATNAMRINADAADEGIYNTATMTAGTYYLVEGSFTKTSGSLSIIVLRADNGSFLETKILTATDTSFKYYYKQTHSGANGGIVIRTSGGAADWTFTGVTIKQVNP